MKTFELKSFAKINLSLDVCGLLDNGYHEVSMVMQQILLCDDISVKWTPSEGQSDISITLTTNKHFLPTDNRNLAYKAAMLMIESFGQSLSGEITIHIKKRIPVAAGLAGGSGNCAAVIHAINQLWNLNLTLQEICDLGSKLGSDVPFCVMGQAAANPELHEIYGNDPLACHCALATGTGTDLKPLPGLKCNMVLSKPAISVSTAEVYQGIDNMEIPAHPDNDTLVFDLKNGASLESIKRNMVNVLENFTLTRYPIIVQTKEAMQELCGDNAVLMSGSGPTVYGFCDNIAQSKQICDKMLEINKESFWTRTTW